MARLEHERVIKYIRQSHIRKAYLIRAGIVAAVVAAVVLIGWGATYFYQQKFDAEEVSAEAEKPKADKEADEVEIALLETSESTESATDSSEATKETAEATENGEVQTGGEASGTEDAEANAPETKESETKESETKESVDGTSGTKASEPGAPESKGPENGKASSQSSETKKDGPPEVLVKTNADRTKQRDGFLVVVDPGHGGNDGGASAGEIIEKNINLSIAKQVAALLEAEGITVVMTRDTDEYLYLEERTQISNEEEPDLFVSLHCNTYPADSSVHGMDCYFAEGRKDGAFFGQHIMDVIKEHGDVRSRGVKEEDFFVTEYNHWPAVLVEMGFLTNPTDLQHLSDAEFQVVLAQQLTEGIVRGLNASR